MGMLNSLVDKKTITLYSMFMKSDNKDQEWCVYLLLCQGGFYYAGASNDVGRRFEQHRKGMGARFTRANPPIEVLAVKKFGDKSSALAAEWQLKQLPKSKKCAFLLETD